MRKAVAHACDAGAGSRTLSPGWRFDPTCNVGRANAAARAAEERLLLALIRPAEPRVLSVHSAVPLGGRPHVPWRQLALGSAANRTPPGGATAHPVLGAAKARPSPPRTLGVLTPTTWLSHADASFGSFVTHGTSYLRRRVARADGRNQELYLLLPRPDRHPALEDVVACVPRLLDSPGLCIDGCVSHVAVAPEVTPRRKGVSNEEAEVVLAIEHCTCPLLSPAASAPQRGRDMPDSRK